MTILTTNRAEDATPGYREVLDALAEMMRKIPHAPIFATSALFPSDRAWVIKDGERDIYCAGPAFWKRVPKRLTKPNENPFLLSAIQIVDVDLPGNREVRKCVLDALRAATFDILDTLPAAEAPRNKP